MARSKQFIINELENTSSGRLKLIKEQQKVIGGLKEEIDRLADRAAKLDVKVVDLEDKIEQLKEAVNPNCELFYNQERKIETLRNVLKNCKDVIINARVLVKGTICAADCDIALAIIEQALKNSQ